MRKHLLIILNLIVVVFLGQTAMAQLTMPAAITLEPSTATGWDEITLTLDPAQACVPDGKASVEGAAKVMMHSAAVLFDQKEDFEAKSVWGSVGIDYDATPKDGVNEEPALTPNGDGTYSITFVPGDFYGVEEGSTIIGITAVFNAGTWDNEAKDFGDDGCSDFFIPLTYTDPTPALKFKLDLTYQEELGNFTVDGGKAYVIVDGEEYDMGDPLLEGLFQVAKYEFLLKEGITEGTEYTYKFKMDDTEESIDARTVTATGSQLTLSHMFNDESKPVETGTITFKCDLRYYAREDKFVPGTDTVDIAGDMNGWDGSNHLLTDEDGDTIYEITVAELELYKSYNFKFRINGSWDAGRHDGGSNRVAMARPGERTVMGVMNHYAPGQVPVTLAVNMSRLIDAGIFDPEKDFVDVAGTFNGWSGSTDLVDGDDDGIFITSPDVLHAAGSNDTAQYKFRINGNWETSEFPGGGPNRELAIMDTTGGVMNKADTVWYNNIPLFIDQNQIATFGEVSIYPNPVKDVLYIRNEVDMLEIKVINITGQVVRRIAPDSRKVYEMNTSELREGVYILRVSGEKGYVGTAKFIKK